MEDTLMENGTVSDWESRVAAESRSALDEALREGAQRMLRAALEAEVDEYVGRHAEVHDAAGRRLVVRNGR